MNSIVDQASAARALDVSQRVRRWRSIASVFLAVALASPATPAAAASQHMPISAYDDDPFVDSTEVEKLRSSVFHSGADGLPILSNSRIAIGDEQLIYLEDPATGDYRPFANNPWPCEPDPVNTGFCLPPKSNGKGDFRFPREERFPLHLIERGPDGRPLLDANGRQIWKPRDLHLGSTTAFEAAQAALEAVEEWSGRVIPWGKDRAPDLPQDDRLLFINSHAFIDFNAFFSPTLRELLFGLVPYRLVPGGPVLMFEMATSWEIAAHEAGHALQAELKPNRQFTELGYRTWGESFGDQLAMWASLRDPQRVRALLKETRGNLNGSNAMTRLGEALGGLVNDSTVALRDAFNDESVSTTTAEVHDRSRVLTGAAYRFFLAVHAETARTPGSKALEEAGDILGTFLTRSADYVPENTMTLEDVAKGYLKVDKEFFGGRYRTVLVGEFTRREIFDAGSLSAWLAHEAAVPSLHLSPRATEQEIDELVQSNLDRLGIGPDLGLKLQSVVRDGRRGQTIVRVELTLGRGAGARPLGNHGILVFRANGTLADYHGPLPSGVSVNVRALIALAEEAGLGRHGTPLSIVRRPDGAFTVEARVMHGPDWKPYVKAFTLENPEGERREIVPSVYGGAAKADLLKDAGLVLDAADLMDRDPR